jgi:rRNA small subunit pseudouridine methyltransferase Nep1
VDGRETVASTSLTLHLALVEAALQLVPREIQSDPQVKKYAERRMKRPTEVLLDRAFHHTAMQKLARKGFRLPVEKMGRPDIIHNTLLQILETPLNWENQLRVFIHTQDDYVISINPQIRLPKNYIRFIGLIEQLFAEKQVPQRGDALMKIEKGTVQSLITRIRPSQVLGFSVLGQPTLMRTAAKDAGKIIDPLVFIGGFPRGHFSNETRHVLNSTFKVDRASLDAWVVAGRFVYDFEWVIGVAQQRVKTKNEQP